MWIPIARWLTANYIPQRPRIQPQTDLLNDRVLPIYEQQQLPVLRILTGRGTEYCGKVERHDDQLYLTVNEVDHTKTKVKSRKMYVICERVYKTILQESHCLLEKRSGRKSS